MRGVGCCAMHREWLIDCDREIMFHRIIIELFIELILLSASVINW